MPTCWSAVGRSMASAWWVRCSPITVGKPKPARASTWRTFSWTGKRSKQSVHKDSSVRRGAWRGSASKWWLRRRSARGVRRALSVRTRLPTGRVLHLRPQAAHEALQARRQEQQTQEFRQQYATRAGIEGTLSQGVRRMALRRARYDGLQKVHVQHVFTAVAINGLRIDAVLTQTPRGQTRRSPFARLVAHSDLQEAVGA